MKIIKNKETKHALLSAILFVTIIAFYVELNVLIEKINIHEIDMSGQQIYTLSEESKNKINTIDKSIEIKLVNFSEDTEYAVIDDVMYVINQYQKLNGKISITKENANNTQNGNSAYPYLIIKSDEKSTKIAIDDLFISKVRAKEGNTENYYAIEEVVTNNICKVASNDDSTIYLYTEKIIYDETSLYSFALRMECLGNNVDFLELSNNEAIPDNCKCIVIPPLKEDITENEKKLIEDYINRGGNILFIEESKSLTNVDTPNLDFVRKMFGYEMDKGVMLDSENHAEKNPGLLYLNVNTDNDVFNRKNSYTASMLDATRIKFVNDEELNKLSISYQPIISAGETAYIRYNLQDTNQEISSTDEPANGSILGACIKKKVGENESKAVVYSNSIFATDIAVGVVVPNTENIARVRMISMYDNEEILSNTIKYLSENNNSIIIRKIQKNDKISNSKIDATTLKIIFGIPLFILFSGYVVWRIRKSK